MDIGEEGVVVKSLSSPYILGDKSKRGQSWVKLKPDYGSGWNELDFLVLGRYLGDGKFGRGFGFLCGVIEDNYAPTPKYLTVAKVGTGLK